MGRAKTGRAPRLALSPELTVCSLYFVEQRLQGGTCRPPCQLFPAASLDHLSPFDRDHIRTQGLQNKGIVVYGQQGKAEFLLPEGNDGRQFSHERPIEPGEGFV